MDEAEKFKFFSKQWTAENYDFFYLKFSSLSSENFITVYQAFGALWKEQEKFTEVHVCISILIF